MAWPAPEPSAEKTPGVDGATGIPNRPDACPRYVTCTSMTEEGIPNGAMAFTWFAEAYRTGPGTPSKSTWVPPRLLATSPAAVNCVPAGIAGPRLEPKIATAPPGETAPVE